MRKFLFFLIGGALLATAGFSGCNIINPEEPVPTYIHIDSFGFDNTNPRGSTSRNVTNVWAYVDNQPVGTFDLPATFPVIVQSNSVLTVLPGIDFDGLRGYPVTYPPFAADNMTITPKPGQTINWQPKTYYLSGSLLLFNETFDQAGTLKFNRRSGDAEIQRSTADVFEGAGSGIIQLGAGKDSMTVLSDSLAITTGRAAYVELDYKGDMPLTVGMRSYLADGNIYEEYLIGFREQANWKKFYVGVREFVGGHVGTKYQIILGTKKPDGQSTGTVNIDNVKLVSF
jgi:hypothetical protein